MAHRAFEIFYKHFQDRCNTITANEDEDPPEKVLITLLKLGCRNQDKVVEYKRRIQDHDTPPSESYLQQIHEHYVRCGKYLDVVTESYMEKHLELGGGVLHDYFYDNMNTAASNHFYEYTRDNPYS